MKRSPRQVWTPAEEAYLRRYYADGSTAEIAKRLKRSIRKVYAKAKALGLRKTREYLRNPKNRCGFGAGSSVGERTRFQKGRVPWNKGVRRPGWRAGRMRETQFKPGCRSGIAARNWRPVGTIRVDPCGYRRIKVREAAPGEPYGFGNSRAWPQLHRFLWELVLGKIPDGHILVFKDGDRAHCAIENLELISMAENARRNSMWNRYPRELAEAIQLQGALKRKMRRIYGAEHD